MFHFHLSASSEQSQMHIHRTKLPSFSKYFRTLRIGRVRLTSCKFHSRLIKVIEFRHRIPQILVPRLRARFGWNRSRRVVRFIARNRLYVQAERDGRRRIRRTRRGVLRSRRTMPPWCHVVSGNFRESLKHSLHRRICALIQPFPDTASKRYTDSSIYVKYFMPVLYVSYKTFSNFVL